MTSKKLFPSYSHYINHQIKGANRTHHRTYSHERLRIYLLKEMERWKVSSKSMLCVGARDKNEVEFFNKNGFKTTGFDIAASEKLIVCDMSKMYQHGYFVGRKYDIVMSIEAMEHCLDLEGFIKGLNLVCKKYFVCMMTNLPKPTQWDCGEHPFMVKTAFNSDKPSKYSIKEFHQKLEETFTEFKIVMAEIHKRGTRLVFMLEKIK